MKEKLFLNILYLAILFGFISVSHGATIYLSSSGNDLNNGSTSILAVKSFSRAQTLAASGDIIQVSGMIDFWSDPANTTFTQISATPAYSTTNKTGIVLLKTLIIQGTSSTTDGFQGTNGSNSTRFIQINGNFTLTLKNLKLANGKIETPLTTITQGGGAISMALGAIVAENVIFDSNNVLGHNGITGGAINVSNTGIVGLSFKNCLFSNNTAFKSGAIYINDWAASSTIKFESCSFISNQAINQFGGSALFIRTANNNNSLSLINCTITNNKVLNTSSTSGTAGGAIYVYKGSTDTTVNIVNCTITENTTIGSHSNCAGVYMLNSTGNYLGKLNISNSIIEGNTAASNAYADFNTTTTSPTTTTLQINNSIIGRYGAASVLPSGCVGATNYFNYLTSTSVPADLKAKFGTFNTTNNSYPLLSTSPAIDLGASSYLSSLIPAVNTDQLGNTRTFTTSLCSAGSVEFSAASGEQIWRGSTSTDTTVGSNWFGGVPPTSGGSYITIPALSTFKPVFAANFTINGGLIESGSSLTINSGITLTNMGILTNNGTITNTSGNLILKSTNTDKGYLISNSSVDNVTQEHYLSSNQRGWRLLSNPLTNTTYGSVATNSTTPLTLGAGAAKSYDSASNTWTAITSDSDTWAAKTAKALFVRGITSEVTSSTYSVTTPSNVTIAIKGAASNVVPASVSTTVGQYYLVANPYTAPVSVASIIAASTGLSNTVSYYDPTNGSNGSNADLIIKYGGYNYPQISGVAGSASDIILPPMGAIFVLATGNGSINIPKTTIFTGNPLQTGTYNHKTVQTKIASTPILKIEVTSNNTYYDTVSIQFKSIGDTGNNIDFGKLPNTVLDAYSMVGGQKMAVSELELKEQTIPLGITSTIQKNYTFKVSKNTLPIGYEAVLVDNVLNTETVLSPGINYNFTIENNPATQGNKRFAINLKTAGTLSIIEKDFDSKLLLWPNPAHDHFNILNTQNQKDETTTIEISTINGQVIHSQKSNSGTTTTILTNGWNKGIYILKTTNNGTQTTKKLIIR